MFTRMQKYHKTFLVFVTIIIAASFGMGSLMFNYLDPSTRQIVGTFENGKVEINQREFNTSWENFQQFFDLTRMLSPKAIKIQQVRKGVDTKEFEDLFRMHNPVWDAIFSLREDVAKLDQKLNEQVNDPTIWKWVTRGYIDPIRIEINFYQELQDKDRENLLRRLPRSDAWNFLMLLHQAKTWGVEVKEEEVTKFLSNTKEIFPGGASGFAERMQNLKITAPALNTTAEQILTILKYLNARTIGIQVSSEKVQQQYAESNTQYTFQWMSMPYKMFLAQSDADYLKERQMFYEEMSKTQLSYFRIPSVSDIEYLSISAKDISSQVQVSQEEINKEYYAKHPEDDFQDDSPKVIRQIREEKQKIEDTIRCNKANEKALATLREIQEQIVGLGKSIALDVVASGHGFGYRNFANVSEEQFGKIPEFAQGNSKDLIFRTLSSGQISGVLDVDAGENYKTYYIVRLNNRTEGRIPSKQELEDNEALFLDRYYANESGKLGTRYQIAYVIADYAAIAKNICVTTKTKYDFYEKYKKELYAVVSKDAEGKNQTSYRPFAEVEGEITPKVSQALIIQEMQKIHDIQRICKDKGNDVQLGVIVRELANQIMMVPEGIVYVEENFRTLEEIQANNPAGDTDIYRLNEDSSLSDVKNTNNGKYFYKVLVQEKLAEKDFAQVRSEIKELFLKNQAIKHAQEAVKELAQLYKQQSHEISVELQQRFDEKIKKVEGDLRQRDVIVEEKQQKLQNLSIDVFKVLAMQKGLALETSYPMTEEGLYGFTPFRGLSSQFTTLTKLNDGEVSEALVSESIGEIFLVQMVAKKVPGLAEIPPLEFQRIHNLLWENQYKSRLVGFLTHSRLAQDMGFTDEEMKDRDVEDNEPTRLPVQMPVDIGD